MKTCMIVDDSRVIRKVSRHLLEGMGFEVGEAGNGQEALEACAVAMPELILLDWNMPVMSGIEFRRCGQARPARLPKSCSARPKTMCRTSARHCRPAPTNM